MRFQSWYEEDVCIQKPFLVFYVPSNGLKLPFTHSATFFIAHVLWYVNYFFRRFHAFEWRRLNPFRKLYFYGAFFHGKYCQFLILMRMSFSLVTGNQFFNTFFPCSFRFSSTAELQMSGDKNGFYFQDFHFSVAILCLIWMGKKLVQSEFWFESKIHFSKSYLYYWFENIFLHSFCTFGLICQSRILI